MHQVLLSVLILLAVQGFPAAPRAAGDVATFKIANDNRAAVTDRVVSFGQIFPRGAVRPKDPLTVTLGPARVPSQLDAKALYPDGSVRHGIVAIRAPAMAAGAALDGVIAVGGAGGPAARATPGAATPQAQVTVTFRGARQGETLQVDLPSLMRAPAARKERPWLAGPLVQEQRYYSKIINGIQVVFDVRTPVVGPTRIDVIFHNDSAQNADIATQVYDASISLGGRPIYKVEGIQHYTYATWHKEIYTDGALPLRVTPDTRLLMATGAVPRYAAVRPDAEAMDKLNRLAAQNDGPLGFAAITPYMPTTGGRPDIGPLPASTVFYLLQPSRENQRTLFANADAAGSVPWHVRDMETGGPINIDDHPEVWLDGRGEASPGILNRKYYTLDTKWQPDDAHQPSLTYLPYLLTGSQYYRDELAMQAGYNLLAVDPEYRRGADGSFLGLQVRAVAWNLRTLANAAYILPSDSPLQAYFQSKLEGNLREIIRRYVKGDELEAAGELSGYFPGPYAVEGATPPWQTDYLVIVLGWIDSMGFRDARPILEWMTNFVAGRFTNAGRGYDPIYGTPYFLYVADPHSHELLNAWSAAFNATFDPVQKPVRELDYPDWGGGYAALARGALASIINATGAPRAKEAYAFVKKHTPHMEASYRQEPNFAIAPVRPEAH